MSREANRYCLGCGIKKTPENTYIQHKETGCLRSLCKVCFNKRGLDYYTKNKEAIQQRQKRNNRVIKQIVLTHYGNNKLACVHCGFGDIRALSIDHIYGGGIDEFRRLFGSRGRHGGGSQFYYYLRKQDYPEGYQTLCFNCQWIKRAENNEL